MPETVPSIKLELSHSIGEKIMLRKLAVLALLAVVLAAAYGAAASIGVSGGAIQYGVDADLTCDDAIAVSGWGLETDDNSVRSVRIGDIAAACYGNALFVTVLDGGGAVLAHGEVAAIDSAVESVSFGSPVNVESITQLKVWVEGPVP
jgi:hypothetical protein